MWFRMIDGGERGKLTMWEVLSNDYTGRILFSSGLDVSHIHVSCIYIWSHRQAVTIRSPVIIIVHNIIRPKQFNFSLSRSLSLCVWVLHTSMLIIFYSSSQITENTFVQNVTIQAENFHFLVSRIFIKHKRENACIFW